jgi:hypothetical protein
MCETKKSDFNNVVFINLPCVQLKIMNVLMNAFYSLLIMPHFLA